MSVSSSAVVAAPVRATAPLPSSPFPFQGLVVPMGPGNWPAPSAITHASDKEKERYQKDYNWFRFLCQVNNQVPGWERREALFQARLFTILTTYNQQAQAAGYKRLNHERSLTTRVWKAKGRMIHAIDAHFQRQSGAQAGATGTGSNPGQSIPNSGTQTATLPSNDMEGEMSEDDDGDDQRSPFREEEDGENGPDGAVEFFFGSV
ncbi:hypothetical protein EG329_013763 [Mollisiaceae sp. DMI_Dod_QoI]|nr:hypothetical protein EG329_013763 [Helotiales sp. DMI_Dod_QoI]